MLRFYHVGSKEKSQVAEVNSSDKSFTVSFAARSGLSAVSEMPDTTFEILWSNFPFTFHVLIDGAERYAEKL